MSVFSFLVNNLSKYQPMFTKLGMCIDIMEIWYMGLLMGRFHQFLTVISQHKIAAVYYRFTFLMSLRKHAYSNILKFLPPKYENFQMKNSDNFHISAQNIDCGDLLELPSNILKFLPPKYENFQMKNSNNFHISAQNIDCGDLLELPHRGSSNESPQSMFLSRNKKTNVCPCKLKFYHIKVGFKGVKII